MSVLAIDFPVPAGMSYQWCTGDLIVAETGWVPVPRLRHADLLDGKDGIIVAGGLTLCERPASATATALEFNRKAVDKQVLDWWDTAAGLFGDRQRGFVAAVSVTHGDGALNAPDDINAITDERKAS